MKTPLFTVGYTHSGTMHADDIFSAAFLQLLCPEITIYRVMDTPPNPDKTDIVFDVGMGKYDHHEPNSKKERRENGIPYAAFGKLWRDYGRMLVQSEYVWQRVEEDLVQPLDLTDNTGEPNLLSEAFDWLNKVWDVPSNIADSDKIFFEAVEIAKTILHAKIEQIKSVERARKLVLNAKQHTKDILILEKGMPWQETVISEMPNIKIVIFPSDRGGYIVQNVPIELGSDEKRINFLPIWLQEGKDESIGLTKCLAGNYIGITNSLENAIKVAEHMVQFTNEK